MHTMEVNNNPTPPLSDAEALAFVNARATYDYPKAYVAIASSADYDIVLAPNVFGRFVLPQAGQVTDLWLDNYHYKLLHAPTAEERLLGLSSVFYWGYFSHNDAYARNKLSWLIEGYKSKPATTPSMAMSCLQAAIESAEQQQFGEALSKLNAISQLGQTPMASKVIAFMSPAVAGVYDNRIADGLKTTPWFSSLALGIGSTTSRKVGICYQSWCLYLSQVAAQLNLGIQFGADWSWTCGDDQNQQWRALDVERALFALYGDS